MIKNYFKTAWRSLWKNKFYTVINISGLAVGLATGIMLLLWVQHEFSYDKFNKDYPDIYQLSSHFQTDGDNITWEGVPGPLAIFAKSIPEVQSSVRILREFDQVLSNKEKRKIFDRNTVAFVDSGFLSMFDFPLVKGNKATVFPDNNSVVITQSTAQKLFGDSDAIGETIIFFETNFIVTGVLQDFPENSSIRYDALFPMDLYAQQFTANGGNGDWKTIDEDMGNFGFNTFVKLQSNAGSEKIGEVFSAAYKKARNGDSDVAFRLQNLADIHLINAGGNNSALRMVQIFMLVVILLLAIASINYVNLSTARALLRAKETSVRKIIGANKWQLFFQFMIETVVLFLLATLIAIALIFLLMPFYNSISGKMLYFSLSDISIWKAVAIAVLGTLLASSIYPALLLSSFKPIESLKGKFSSGLGTVSFRKALVIFQFSISIILLVCTIIMSNQMTFLKKKDLGYDKSYVFTVPLTQKVGDHLDAIKAELNNQHGILNIATSDAYNFSNLQGSTGDIDWEAKPANSNMIITQVVIDKDFISTMKIPILEGKDFNGTPVDSSHFILNETAVKQMGLKQPYVGQQISFHSKEGTIIGVVKDFNFQSLKEKVSPLIFFSWWKGNILYIRTTAENAQQAIAAVEKQYKKYADNSPFSYNFIDKQFEAQYQSDQRAGTLFRVFAGIAIFISCLGLFGLVTYTMQVKIKEIGIRKVLGASVSSIVQLLSKDFLKLVFIAFIIAIPIAWWATNKWLEGFAYRVNISWWIFVAAGILALSIALITVSFQAIKAAIANPVDSLRDE